MNGQWQTTTHLPYLVITGPDAIVLENTVWDDAQYPFFARQLDTSAGHLDYDVAELGVRFDDTSRYDDLDQIGIVAQMRHRYALGTNLRPHVHWMQSHANIPNMLLKYRVYDQGASPPSWTLAAATTHAYSYTSGTILQISSWPEINMSAITGVSAFVDVKIYRDTANTSTVFAGADPLVGDWLAKEFDLHFEIDSMGSREPYTK